MRLRNFWNADKIFSIIAFLISIGTFSTFIYQTHLIQKQQYASALPYLEIWNSNPGNGNYKLILINNGVGPAFIKDIKIHYKGKVYNNDPAGFIYKVILPKDSVNFFYSNIPKGRVIPPGQEIEMLGVTNSVKDAVKLRKLFGDETAKIEIVFTSVYEETWQLVGMSITPKKLID